MIKIKKELARHSVAELNDLLGATQKKLYQLKTEQVVGRLRKTSELWKARKTIAMVKTMLTAEKIKKEMQEVQHAAQ